MKFLKLIILLFSLNSVFSQNSMSIKDLESGPGDASSIVIALDNVDEVSGFQFTLKVPNNLIVKEKEVSFIGRNTNHVVYPKNQGNGNYLFICFSGTNDTFTGTSGDLIEIPIETPLTYLPTETYDMSFSDVIISSSSGEDIGSNHQNGVLTVTEGENPDLIVESINFPSSEITPNDTFTVNWNVKNIGKSPALGGWREQIYLSSSSSDKEYLISTQTFSGDVSENQSIERTADIIIPSVLGFEGGVNVKIVLLPYTTVKETAAFKLNNTTLSATVANLNKIITFTIDKTEVVKNSEDKIRVNISRSGAITTAEEFTITANENEDLDTPLTIMLDENQYSNYGDISLKENTTYTGDKTITLTATGGDYTDQTNTVTVIEDKEIILSIDYPSNYSSEIGSSILFTLTANNSHVENKTVEIRSDNSDRLQLPETIVLVAGETIQTFEGIIIDPEIVGKKETSIVYASADNYVTASKEIVLDAVNIPDFELVLAPATVSEGDGVTATYATLTRTTQTDKNAIIAISADQEDRLILPDDFSFEPGEVEKRFNIGTIDNASVEGDQTITVFSKIKFDDCSCVDDADPTTITSGSVTIIDNDGLALTLSASPSTVKAGVKDNSLIITRNTTNADILKEAIEVTLSSNFPSVLDLPTSVTIPANESEVTITFDSKIDASLEGDQNVRIEANATDYNVGFAWVLITDQNLPDVIISDIQLPNEVEAGTETTLESTITNQGYADFESGAKLEYYLSSNNSIAGLDPFNETILTQGIAVGESYDFSEEIQFPVQSGELNLIVVINALNSIKELSASNNQKHKKVSFLPAYTVSITLDKAIYKAGEKVSITGEAKRGDGTIVPISDVEITIENDGFSRVFEAKTNNAGMFAYEFEPLENESGNYTVKAAYPGADIAVQETFDILGFEFVNKEKYTKWEPFVGFPLGKDFVLKNNTSVSLTGVQINLPADIGFTIDQTPVTIGAGQEVALGFTINSTEATIENSYVEVPITITSIEGAEYNELIYYYSKTKEAYLVTDPISINTTMAKDATRLYEFAIQNIGDVDANNVEVLLPSLPWLALKSPEIIEVVKAGEEAKVVLELAPTLTEQVNIPISGTFVLKGSNSNSVTLPFRIETVSDAMGKIIVDATDEYTYNTASAPHLSGAKVLIKHPYSGEIIVEGFTDENGLFEVPSISEGYYTVSVSADKHNPYQNTIVVDPGKTTMVNAFMQYQAVTYNWEVIPTEITDDYDITLITEFETNVPKPVIVMELDNQNLDLESGESRLLNLTITNHGLIAANRVIIGTSEIDGYEMEPLITSMDTLRAKTTVVVPVLLKRNTAKSADKTISRKAASEDCPDGSITFEAYYPCNGDEKIFSFTSVYSRNCGTPPTLPYTLDIGPGYPTFDIGGFEYDLGPYGGPYVPTDFPDLCDPCVKEILTTAIKCSPPSAVASAALCLIEVGTSTSFKELWKALKGCKKKIKRKLNCAKLIKETIKTCIKEALGLGGKSAEFQKIAVNDKWDYIIEDLEKIDASEDAILAKIDEYLKNEELQYHDDFILFINEVALNVDDQAMFTNAQIATIKSNLSSTSVSTVYIDTFTERWNNTVTAWGQNIFSPNSQFPDIVDKIKIDEYQATIDELKAHTTSRGFVSTEEMYSAIFEDIEEYQKEKEAEETSVCATVTIEFPQRITMTREAFEGTLTISNSSEKSIKEIKLDLIVTNEIGENKTDLFQINTDAFLDGTGIVDPDSNGSGVAIFIPTKNAAPEVAQSYSFGGILSYFDEELGETVSITLNPVTLEVNPSPDLILDYFLQRDILGDDPLTEDIAEPSYPAELSLMITNDGFGVANNVKVESMQPRIVENEKGLAIDFEMIGSNFNNEPSQLGLLEVDYGTIEAKTSSIGQWYFTSSLLGHFVSYDINVNHVSDYSNENLSLIKEANIHELVKSVKAYQDGNDDLADFLVNDAADANDTPDRIYYSNGISEEVIKAESVVSSNDISGAKLTTTVTIKPFTTGWNYGNIVDPGDDKYKLESVTRDTDGVEIPLANFWQTTVTLRDGLNPKYENTLHVLDKISEITTYTLSYVSRDANTPTIIAIEGVPEDDSTATTVDLLTVKFNKEIDVNSFTSNNITLIHQGVKLDSDAILIGKIDATTYSITLQDLTVSSGFYELTVSSVGIKDELGNEGDNAMRVQWIQFLNELGILKFESDQFKKQPINSLNITFNKEIRSEEFTNDKITINGNPVNTEVSISKLDDYNYTITGINGLNQEDDSYTLDIDLPLMTAADGTKGLASQSYEWTVDKTSPEVIAITTKSQGGIHLQNITEVDIELNKVLVNDLEVSAITFYKNDELLSIPLTIQKIDDTNYTIYGLGSYTVDNATYKVSIDQTTLIDESDNVGEGVFEDTWTVNLSILNGLENIRIVPDIGISPDDNITSGSDIELVYETIEDNLTVKVYELLATTEALFSEELRAVKGEYRISLAGKVGARRFKVIAYDANGNETDPEIVSMYVDFADIVVDIESIKESDEDTCYDFDYINVSFSDEINALTSEAITLKSSGIEIPKDEVIITKVNDKNYRLDNVIYEGDGLITLEVDKTKVTKMVSGMAGVSTEVKELGIVNKYQVVVDGEEDPVLGKVYEYTATEDMGKYDWIIINGEIISSIDNSVTVKWNQTGEQSLLLRYQTPLSCTSTVVAKVNVEEEASLSVDDIVKTETATTLAPVPNNGQFSIHTSRVLNDCKIEIFNITGQSIYREYHVNFNKNSKNINIDTVPPGIYFLVIYNEGEKLDFKFIIE